MSDSDPDNSPAAVAARAADLIADFQARQEALRTQAQVLARLREATRMAVEREAAELVAKARADIKRTLVDTRRELMMLAMQLRAVGEPLQLETANEPAKSTAPPAFRRDLQEVLADAQPELDELAALSRRFVNPGRTHESDKAPAVPLKDAFPYKAPDTAPTAADRAPAQQSAASERPALTYGDRIRSGFQARTLAIVLAVLGTAAVPILGWRLAVSRDGGGRRPAPAAATDAAKATAPAAASPAPPVSATPPASSRTEASAVSAPLSSDHQTWLWLLVEARRSAWIQTTTDGRADPGRVLQAGESRRILATRSISIVVGDAGAVTLALNGGQPARPGRDGQVVTRQFTIEDATRMAASQVSRGTGGTEPTRAVDAAPARPVAPVNDTRAEVLVLSQRWLDGYYRRDNNAMAYVAVPDATILDNRQVNERLTAGLTQVGRTFDQMQFDLRGDRAALTARMTEQGDMHGYTTQVVSFVSEQWRRQDDRWRLADVRIMSERK